MRILTLPMLGLCLLALSTSVFATGKHMVTYTSKQDFDFVKSAINEAIIEKGLVINTTSHIGDMLERTGKVVKDAKHIFIKAESYEFCSATVSRLTMEADPHNIVFCPYIISVYVLPDEPNKTYISFRKPEADTPTPASKAALMEVEKLLRSIVEEAIQ